MILLNITHIISDQKAKQYLHWLQKEYIPLLKEKAHFQDIKLFKILDSPNEGQSLSLQLFTHHPEDILAFKASLFILLKDKMNKDFQGHLLLFDTTMQYID
ncbi:hypothetical protein GCM10023231_09240 [Olivibacter ginsenosidimutans]|uniref:DUF4286 family protein n=1 Tax=Olivibacter ginsenosidimutans TaxID=1176537 RepID=A0ABP9AQM8_9SPHI